MLFDLKTINDQLQRQRGDVVDSQVVTVNREKVAKEGHIKTMSSRVLGLSETWKCLEKLDGKNGVAESTMTEGRRLVTNTVVNNFHRATRLQQSIADEQSVKEAEEMLSTESLSLFGTLSTCRNVLSREPWNKEALEILSGIIEAGSKDVSSIGKEVIPNYRFEYLRSIGKGVLWTPHDIHASHDGILYVSDHQDNNVHRFSFCGSYIGPCATTFIKPRGIFCGENNDIWVCDLEGKRIVGIDRNGVKVEEIYLPNVMGVSDFCYPCWGVMVDKKFVLVVTNPDKTQFILFQYDPRSNSGEFDTLSLDENDIPCGLARIGNSLLFGSMRNGRLYNLTTRSLEPIGMKKGSYAHSLKAFAIKDNNVFFNYGSLLTKVTLDGEIVFKVDLESCLGNTCLLNYGIAIWRNTSKGALLFVPDGYAKCLHVFSV